MFSKATGTLQWHRTAGPIGSKLRLYMLQSKINNDRHIVLGTISGIELVQRHSCHNKPCPERMFHHRANNKYIITIFLPKKSLLFSRNHKFRFMYWVLSNINILLHLKWGRCFIYHAIERPLFIGTYGPLVPLILPWKLYNYYKVYMLIMISFLVFHN